MRQQHSVQPAPRSLQSPSVQMRPRFLGARREPAAPIRSFVSNHGVLRSGNIVQPNLALGPSNDQFEQGADRVADQLMNMRGRLWDSGTEVLAPSNHSLQRKCACGGTPGPSGECEECRKKRLQRNVVSTLNHLHSEVPPIVYEVLRSPGKPLDPATREIFEPRFGHDFSHVRVHADARAAESAQAVGALAYTVSQNIVLGAGSYSPDTNEGRRILAHELTHVVQQGSRALAPQTRLDVNESGDRFEQQAQHAAEAISEEGAQFSLKLANVDGESDLAPEEEPFARNRKTTASAKRKFDSLTRSQRSALSSVGAPVLQRLAGFVDGVVHETFNLAEQILNGEPAGYTPPLLNHQEVLLPDAAIAAIKGPTLDYRFPKLGSPETECWIRDVPVNIGSFEETVLASGEWSIVTTKSNLLKRFAGLSKISCMAGPGDVTLEVEGYRSNEETAASTRQHEDHHAADHERIFNAIVVPWDNAMILLNIIGPEVFRGENKTACEDALYSAIGGSPEAIGTELSEAWANAADAFHATPGGQKLGFWPPVADSSCTTVTVLTMQ